MYIVFSIYIVSYNILFFRYFVGAIDAAKSDAPVFYPAFAGVFYALVGHVNLQGEVSQ